MPVLSRQLEAALAGLFLANHYGDEDAAVDAAVNLPHVAAVRTFEEAEVLTHDRGVVVEFDDGSEFQITIVPSKGAR